MAPGEGYSRCPICEGPGKYILYFEFVRYFVFVSSLQMLLEQRKRPRSAKAPGNDSRCPRCDDGNASFYTFNDRQNRQAMAPWRGMRRQPLPMAMSLRTSELQKSEEELGEKALEVQKKNDILTQSMADLEKREQMLKEKTVELQKNEEEFERNTLE